MMRLVKKALPLLGAVAWRNRSRIRDWYASRNDDPPPANADR